MKERHKKSPGKGLELGNNYSEQLRHLGSQMNRLADKMDESGEPRRPLLEPEKELVKMAYLPVVNEMLIDLKNQYLGGSKGNIEYIVDNLVGLIEEINNI